MKILKFLLFFISKPSMLAVASLLLCISLDQSLASTHQTKDQLNDNWPLNSENTNTGFDKSKSDKNSDETFDEADPLQISAKLKSDRSLKSHQIVELEIKGVLKPEFKAYVDQFKLTSVNPPYISVLGLNIYPQFQFFDRFSKQNRLGAKNEFAISAALQIPTVLESYPNNLDFNLTYQACTETYCLFPKDVSLKIPVKWEKSFYEAHWPEKNEPIEYVMWITIALSVIGLIGLLRRKIFYNYKAAKLILFVLIGIISLFAVSSFVFMNNKWLRNFGWLAPKTEINWQPYTNETFKAAMQSGKPVFIELFATWCSPCLQMKEEVFTDPQVIEESKNYVALKLDATESSELIENFKTTYQIQSLPAILFFNKDGTRMSEADLRQFEDAEKFKNRLKMYR